MNDKPFDNLLGSLKVKHNEHYKELNDLIDKELMEHGEVKIRLVSLQKKTIKLQVNDYDFYLERT